MAMLFGFQLAKLNVCSAIERGLAMGAASHGEGTARILQESQEAGAFRAWAMPRTALAAWDLIGGRLVRPFAIALPASFAYWIVCPKATAKLPKIKAFTDWLLAEAADDVRRLQKLKLKSHHAKRRSN